MDTSDRLKALDESRDRRHRLKDAAIAAFICAFEDGTLPRSEWTHDRHLVMALWYSTRHPRDEATTLVREGIRRYNQKGGKPDGYHETITLAWLEVIDRFLTATGRDWPVSSLAEALLAECGAKDYLLRHYTRERLFSDEARRGWVPPDRADFDAPGRSEVHRAEDSTAAEGGLLLCSASE